MKKWIMLPLLLVLLPILGACGQGNPVVTTDPQSTESSPPGETGEDTAATTGATTEDTGPSPETTAPAVKKRIRIACVGDSLTYGVGATQASLYSYPYQLQQYLNSVQSDTTYLALNYGKPSAYAINNTEYEFTYPSKNSNAYTASDEYQNSLRCKPDIVIIMLGTNDAYAAAANKEVSEKYTKSLESIVDSYLALSSGPEVILMLPPSRFDNAVRLKSLTDIIHPAVRDVAERKGLRLIDTFTPTDDALSNRAAAIRDKIFNSDGVHLSDKGYEMLAELIGNTLLGENNG